MSVGLWVLIGTLGAFAATGLIGAVTGNHGAALSDAHIAEPRRVFCRVTDGDTLNCDGERVRLLGIDAPEMQGRCRAGRDCVPGDPLAAKANLERAAANGVTILRVGQDRYGRTLAMLEGSSGDLACLQLRAGLARYVERWDNDGHVRRTCPSLTGNRDEFARPTPRNEGR